MMVIFYCLNCLPSFRSTKEKLESHKKVPENKDFYGVFIFSKDTKILKFNKYQNPDQKASIIIFNLY